MFDYTNIPEPMKKAPRWVLWRKIERDGRTTKVPVNAKTGAGARSNDSSTWTTFEDALAHVDTYRCDGLGFMLGNGYFGVDIDHAIDNQPLIDEFVNALHSYTEISQSGEGIHIICSGVLPQGNRRKGNIEMYDDVRYFAMTGNVFDGLSELSDGTESVKPLFYKYLDPSKKEGAYVFKREEPTRKNYPTGVSVLSDEDVLAKALASNNSVMFSALYHGQWENLYDSQSSADLAFCSLLAFWTNKDAEQMDRIFRTSNLIRDKWDTKRGEVTYGEMTIAKAIDGCRDTYKPSATDEVVYNAKSGEAKPKKKNYDLTDTGNAQRYIDTFGEDVRYNTQNKCWLIWDGKTWIRDLRQEVKNKADKLIMMMKKEAFNEPDEKKADAMWKNVKHLASSSGKDAMLKEAQHIGSTATLNSDYDNDIYLLNCENGVVDLRTGKMLPHSRELMMSKNTHIALDTDGEPENWLKALDGIFQGNQDVIGFVRRAIGYTLTGSVKEQCFFQCFGNGSNGKSVFFNTIYNLLGDYSLNAQVESVLTRGNGNSGNASPDIARMNGARFVRTNEPNEGARFNEGLVKQMTGGDVVTARYLYGEDFEFKPVMKLWIASNYKIVVRGTDKGIWRRQRLIPFEAVFEGKNDDKGLEERIKKELPKILWWAVKGCLEWQKEGLGMPDKIKDATEEYRDEMDIVESFSKECLRKKASAREKASDVFDAYRAWARRSNEWDGMTKAKFGLEMGKKYEKKNINGYIYYLGVQLRSHETSYVYMKEDND